MQERTKKYSDSRSEIIKKEKETNKENKTERYPKQKKYKYEREQ